MSYLILLQEGNGPALTKVNLLKKKFISVHFSARYCILMPNCIAFLTFSYFSSKLATHFNWTSELTKLLNLNIIIHLLFVCSKCITRM